MPDEALDSVIAHLESIPDFVGKAGSALRQAIDEVIDPARTGRWSVDQLEKVEKTYIGTRVEIVLRSQLGLERGAVMDCRIAGHEVDIKFSLRGQWMIPIEAVGHLCLLVRADDDESLFGIGLVRALDEHLTAGGNRDRKRTLNSAGVSAMSPIVLNGRLPRNQVLHLDPTFRSHLNSIDPGQARVTELFRRLLNSPIQRRLVEWAARQLDPTKRVRDARKELESEGIRILSGRYDREEAAAVGFGELAPSEYLAYRSTEPSNPIPSVE